MMEAEEALSEPVPAAEKQKKGGVLGRIAKALGFDGDKDAGPPPAPPPPPRKKVAARPAPASPPAAPAMSAPPAMESVAAAEAPASASRRFTDDEAGLRALLLQQGADGLFDGDVGTTLIAVAALVGRGHTARSGSFRAELRRTVQALKSRLGSLTGTDQALVALALAMLRIGSGEAQPTELPAPQRVAEASAPQQPVILSRSKVIPWRWIFRAPEALFHWFVPSTKSYGQQTVKFTSPKTPVPIRKWAGCRWKSSRKANGGRI